MYTFNFFIFMLVTEVVSKVILLTRIKMEKKLVTENIILTTTIKH